MPFSFTIKELALNLTSSNVNKIFMDSLYTEAEQKAGIDESKAVKVEGIVTNVGFNPERLLSHLKEVRELVDQLPEEFLNNGWSFLNLPTTRTGEQWGEQRNAEQLYLLAAGLGIATFLLPREMWKVLPGSVPYINFTTFKA